jgi:hypothetical protein
MELEKKTKLNEKKGQKIPTQQFDWYLVKLPSSWLV